MENIHEEKYVSPRQNKYPTRYGDSSSYRIISTSKGISQTLTFPIGDGSYEEEKLRQSLNLRVSILFAGDLDDDGIRDVMFSVGSEESQENILFLSSHAENGQLLKAVAKRRSGYCC